MNNSITKLMGFLVLLSFFSCKAFMYGYTWNKAENKYYLVTGDKDNFGDKRIKYIKSFHKQSALANFLNCDCNSRGLPTFVYEYETTTKCRGIRLYYAKIDSVFFFEEPKKNNHGSIQTNARKMNETEHQSFEKLKTAK